MMNDRLIRFACASMIVAGVVLAHGFPTPAFNPPANSAPPNRPTGVGRPTGSTQPGQGGGTARPGSGSTTPRGPGGGITRTGMKRTDAPEFKDEGAPDADAAKGRTTKSDSGGGGNGGAPASNAGPTEAVMIRTKEFNRLAALDAAAVVDRTTTLSVRTTDLAATHASFRVRLVEVQDKSVARRLEVLTGSDAAWTVADVYVLRTETTGRTTVWRKDAAGRVTELAKTPGEIRVLDTSVTLADLLPIDPSHYECVLDKPSQGPADARETYVLKMKGSGTTVAKASFDAETRRVGHVEWLAGGTRVRASDWSGWRVVGGVAMPSRVTVLGSGLEPVAFLDVVEARLNTKPDAALVDPTKLKN